MRELSTIQKREKLNQVFSVDEPGPGGAHHKYIICAKGSVNPGDSATDISNGDIMAEIQMQCGPRKEEDSTHGVIDSDLLEIVRDRLISFQAGPFSSRENAIALTHIEEALMWLNRRVEDRIERNVLGENKK